MVTTTAPAAQGWLAALADELTRAGALARVVATRDDGLPPAAREVLARASKRLSSHIEHHGVDDRALELADRYAREYEAALAPVEPAVDDLAALVDATAEPPLVAPALLANAQVEQERRAAVAVSR